MPRGQGQGQPQAPMLRSIARTAADHMAAFGWRPLLRSDEHRIIGGPGQPLQIRVPITDNATQATDLRTPSLWDIGVQTVFGAGSAPMRAWLHLEGLSVYVNDADFLTEAVSLKEALDNQLYITITSQQVTYKLPMRSRIWEPAAMVDFKQAAAANESRYATRDENPLWLPKVLQIDMEADVFQLNNDTAINWATTDIISHVMVYGSLIPKGVPGSDVSHINAGSTLFADDQAGAYTTATPMQMAQITAAWLSRMLRRR